jgi:hypothetical protein
MMYGILVKELLDKVRSIYTTPNTLIYSFRVSATVEHRKFEYSIGLKSAPFVAWNIKYVFLIYN